jgi:hypothetical protein
MDKYRVAQKSVNLKYSLLLKGMFGLLPTYQFVEQYHRIGSSALNVEDLVLNQQIIKKFLKYLSIHFTK